MSREPGRDEDALPPLSMLHVHEISVQKRCYIHVAGGTDKPLVLYFPDPLDAIPWLCALECSKISARHATTLAMQPDDPCTLEKWWCQRLAGLARTLEAAGLSGLVQEQGSNQVALKPRPAPVNTVPQAQLEAEPEPKLWQPASPLRQAATEKKSGRIPKERVALAYLEQRSHVLTGQHDEPAASSLVSYRA